MPKKKPIKEVSITEAAAIRGVKYSTIIGWINSKRNPLPAQRKPGHGMTKFINVADLKRYKPSPVGWPEGLTKEKAREKATD